MLNALTVDVEDYYHVSAFEDDIERDHWDRYESRVAANTRRILALLERHSIKATFFVLGWVAERFPGLVREIHRAGHELGSHGFWHRLIYEQSPAEFRADLVQSRSVIEDTIGEAVTAFRAPSFSVTNQSLWALDILAEEGFRCDSSVFPIYHDRYGIPDAEPYLHRFPAAGGSLWEFPPSVLRVAGLNVPVSGGGYFRLFPLQWTVQRLMQINRNLHKPFLFYVHPWEMDPEQPRLRAGSRSARLRHYMNLSSTQRKLDALLGKFRFGRVCDVVEEAQHDASRVTPKQLIEKRR